MWGAERVNGFSKEMGQVVGPGGGGWDERAEFGTTLYPLLTELNLCGCGDGCGYMS